MQKESPLLLDWFYFVCLNNSQSSLKMEPITKRNVKLPFTGCVQLQLDTHTFSMVWFGFLH